MGSLWKYVTGQTGRKINKTKQKVRDVQALRRAKSGSPPANLSGQHQVNRAAARLGVNPGKQFTTPKVR